LRKAGLLASSGSFVAQDGSLCDSSLLENVIFPPSLKLVWNLFEQFQENAFHILRKRIFLNYEPTFFCKEILRVGAKRFRVEQEAFLDAHFLEPIQNWQSLLFKPIGNHSGGGA
jgi:hypothetical protein